MHNNNRGMALIVVLWIMVALVLLAGGISLMARTETQISRNYSDQMRCKWAAKAGVYAAINQLKDIVGQEVTYLGEELYEQSSDELEMDLDGYSFSFTLEDECAKININEADGEMLALLFGSDEIADCIIDWRDEDEQPQMQGAESDYYATLSPPYLCKNADFETVAELLLVKGISEDILDEYLPDGEIALWDLLTTSSSPVPVQTANQQQVDISTADNQALQDAFGEILSEEDINAIIAFRTAQPFESVSQIVLVPNLDRAKVIQIYDMLNLGNQQNDKAIINVNTASADALSVLPEMDYFTAWSIVDYRAQQGEYESIAELLQNNELSNEAFAAAAPYFALKSRVFKIVSEGFYDKSGVSVMITCIVEMQENGQAKIKYWQE